MFGDAFDFLNQYPFAAILLGQALMFGLGFWYRGFFVKVPE